MLDYDILAIHPGYTIRYSTSLERVAQAAMSRAGEEKEVEQSRLLQVAGTVAIININGGLTNSDSYWNRYDDLVSYNEIREAVIQALEAGVGSIVFNHASSGGSAYGMYECGDFISNIPVPTLSHTAGMMCSADYFLGMQADYIYASNLSDVGSIGVVIKMYDRTKMLQDVGIEPKRFRSGSLKMVGDSDFKLTDEEEKYIQGKVDTLANSFFTAVSDARGLTIGSMKSSGILTGKTYFGQDAVEVGLIDDVLSFDGVMLKAYDLAAKHLDKNNQRRIFS